MEEKYFELVIVGEQYFWKNFFFVLFFCRKSGSVNRYFQLLVFIQVRGVVVLIFVICYMVKLEGISVVDVILESEMYFFFFRWIFFFIQLYDLFVFRGLICFIFQEYVLLLESVM